MDGRLNVNISAQQALQMGLISKVTPLTAEKRKEINALAGSVGIAAIHQEIKIQNKMTIQDIQAQHPEAYAAIFNAGKNAESIRVKTILAWHRIDPETTIAMVKDGREMAPDVTAEFQVKGLQAQNIANITADATPNVNPPATATTTATADASVTAFMEGVKANLQRNKIIS
jgi:enoyl-CoA hydratase/carnithine racemase